MEYRNSDIVQDVWDHEVRRQLRKYSDTYAMVYNNYYDPKIVHAMLRSGTSVEALREEMQRSPFSFTDEVRHLVGGSTLEIAKWACEEELIEVDPTMVRAAARSGKVDILLYLYPRLPSVIIVDGILGTVARAGLKMVEAIYPLTTKSQWKTAMKHAFLDGKEDVFHWLRKKGLVCTLSRRQVLTQYLLNDDWPAFCKLYREGDEIKNIDFHAVGRKVGNLESIRKLADAGIDIDGPDIIAGALKGGHLDFIEEWNIHVKDYVNGSTIRGILRSGPSSRVLRFIDRLWPDYLRKYCQYGPESGIELFDMGIRDLSTYQMYHVLKVRNVDISNYLDRDLNRIAVEQGDVDFLETYGHHFKISKELFWTAFRRGHLECMQWLAENGPVPQECFTYRWFFEYPNSYRLILWIVYFAEKYSIPFEYPRTLDHHKLVPKAGKTASLRAMYIAKLSSAT